MTCAVVSVGSCKRVMPATAVCPRRARESTVPSIQNRFGYKVPVAASYPCQFELDNLAVRDRVYAPSGGSAQDLSN